MFDADFIKGFEIGKAYRKNLLRAANGEPVVAVSEDDSGEEEEEHE